MGLPKQVAGDGTKVQYADDRDQVSEAFVKREEVTRNMTGWWYADQRCGRGFWQGAQRPKNGETRISGIALALKP